MTKPEILPGTPIAVIGMGCWYPGAPTLRDLWENILARRRQFRRMPDQRLPLSEYYDADSAVPDKTYGTRAAVIDGFEFDWMGRHVPRSTYETADIVHWLALEVALKALADSGYTREDVPNERAGVILGNSLTGEQTRASTLRQRWPFVRKALRAAAEARGLSSIVPELEVTMEDYYKSVFAPTTEDSLSGGLSNTVAGRICNFLDFHGGGYTVDGACSSSLIAVATAAAALANGDMDFTLAGGVDISLDTFELIGFAKTGALTKNDMTVYDRKASGFIPGEGCGFVVLKRLDDARRDGDFVYAVLRGWGISSDGKGGLTAPGKVGQATALRRAYARAGYSPRDNAFFEGHGTGTTVGDKIELQGIALAVGNDFDPQAELRAHGMTSFKSLVGHTKAAAGIGGFIKAVMAVNRRVIPPTCGCKEPNAVFDEDAKFLYPVFQGEVCDPQQVMRAGVSAMGFGGINCHVTLESGDAPAKQLVPSLEERALLVSNQDSEVFVFSADSLPALVERVEHTHKLAQGISMAEVPDLAAKLGREDTAQPLRAAFVAGTPEELLDQLDALLALLHDNPPDETGELVSNPQNTSWAGNAVQKNRVGFLFPGQGSQQVNMARVLVERHSWVRELVATADGCLQAAGAEPVSPLMFRPLDRALNDDQAKGWAKALSRTEVAQPAICLASVIWMQYLARLGIVPAVMGGHSLGELTAFYASGAFDERTLLRLAALRGRAMAAPTGEAGMMASLACPQDVAAELVKDAPDYVVVANINSPKQTVVSGSVAGVSAVVERAKAREIQAVMLPVSNAFHSRFVATAAEVLRQQAPVPENFVPANGLLLSSTGGQPIQPGLALREHFATQILSQVDFAALARAMAQTCDMMIEVGPGRVLSGLTRDTLPAAVCLPAASKPGADRDLNTLLARLFVQGGAIHWETLYENRLIRPFVPVAERSWIENQCERPFNVTTAYKPVALPAGSVVEAALASSARLSSAALAEYLAKRGRFLAEVIRADLDMPPLTTRRTQTVQVVTPALTPEVLTPSASTSEKVVTSPADLQQPVLTRLIELIAQRTGYPAESISPSARLLDDLNLDSIKAGDLIATMAKEYGIAGKIEPAALANAALQTIADALTAQLPVNTAAKSAAQTTSVETVLLKLVEQRTGFPHESLKLHMRLLDDLNLDSIKAGDLIATMAKEYGIAGQIEPAKYANASLEDIAEALRTRAGTGDEGAAPERTPAQAEEARTWVRDFVIELVPEELPPAAFDWQMADMLIVHEADDTRLARLLRGGFLSRGAENVQLVTAADAHKQGWLNSPTYTHVVALLPAAPAGEFNLRRAVERLRALVPAVEQPGLVMVFVQAGDFTNLESHGAAAFAASLHLERPELKIRVVNIPAPIEGALLAKRIMDEMAAPEAFAQAAYDADFTRLVPRPSLREPITYAPRSITWTANDVVLVTGGAKGITAECALALAPQTGVRMALVGSSQPGDEAAQTLERFRAAGLAARYYTCNISDASAVRSLVEQVQREQGAITGVIHGAAVNRPRRDETATAQAALDEVTPKVAGALNLCAALKDAPPKLFIGFSSIIGVTGMPGNAWYAFSNELLNLILQSFHAEHPETQVISMAFSVWGEIGMGARMGSTHALAQMGIDAIPTLEGVTHFLRLALCDPSAAQVIIAARLGGLDTWQPVKKPLPPASRYLEKLVSVEPGVEVVARAHLTLARDAYVKDHIYKGSPLFPTVFGLEAMGQAVACVTGRTGFEALRIEDVRLERPIVVDADKGSTIQIHAQVLERTSADEPLRVKAGISTEQTAFQKDHFAAVFVLDERAAPLEPLELPAEPLDIEPVSDLYGWLLFQGPLFQRLHRVYSLDSRRCLFRSEVRSYKGESSPDGTTGPFILGDPYFRDSLLQSAQLTVSQDISLPVHIDRIELYDLETSTTTTRTAAAVFESRDERRIVERVVAVDDGGRMVERLDGYRLQILEHHADHPTPEQIAEPAQFDAARLRNTLRQRAEAFNVRAPEITLAYLRLHDLRREERHAAEQAVLAEAAQRLPAMQNAQPVIEWQNGRKPAIQGVEADLSLSHDDRACLCAAGDGGQGCDITHVMDAPRESFIALLSKKREGLLNQLVQAGDPLPYAGTRIWTAVEALYKATNGPEINLVLEKQVDASVLFRGGAPGHTLYVLTFPIMLTRGPERMVAFVVQPTAAPLIEGFDASVYAIDVSRSGPQGQLVMGLRFPLSFRETATLSRNLYFSHYFAWMGKLREAACQPVYAPLSDQLATGKWGMVTNHAEAQILQTVGAKDMIEGRVWVEKQYGPADATIDLCFEWLRVPPGGQHERVAVGRMAATWVAILDHGIVKAQPFPDYFQRYLNRMTPGAEVPTPWTVSDRADLGAAIYRAAGGPTNRIILREQCFETALEDTNLVGNIYFANYAVWQGRTIDHYLYETAPAYFRGVGEQGEFRCLFSRIEHLREAMPFDTVAVRMMLGAVYERGAHLLFEYYRVGLDGQYQKLAFGEHAAGWHAPDANGQWQAAELPAVFRDALLRTTVKG